MLQNRSMPRCAVIPELAYPDLGQAVDWLCDAFGFEVRLRIAGHRAQLNVGDGAIVLTQARTGGDALGEAAARAHAVMVRVEDAQGHYGRAKAFGAEILHEPADAPYGERQYSCRDLGGHVWTFSQSIADVAPEDWGGVAYKLA